MSAHSLRAPIDDCVWMMLEPNPRSTVIVCDVAQPAIRT